MAARREVKEEVCRSGGGPRETIGRDGLRDTLVAATGCALTNPVE